MLDNDAMGYKYIDERAERHDAVLVSYFEYLKQDAEAIRSIEAKRVKENARLEDGRHKRLNKEIILGYGNFSFEWDTSFSFVREGDFMRILIRS